ncbi:hypothetical protein ACROYT_G032954 [Oculina patagonica]
MKALFLALAVHCFIRFTSAQNFEITRQSHGRDVFYIPSSTCNRNAANSGRGCKSFYAWNGERNCSCLCPARNATFAFYNKRWACVENRKLRRYLGSGCEFVTSFSVETADRRLPTLAFGQRREMSLNFPFWEFWRCSLDFRNSWFKGCWGSKQFLRHYNASAQLFTLTRRRSTAPYFLKVNSNIPNTDIFRGKIFNLILDCRVSRQLAMGFNFHTRNCLLFKLQGNTTCPVSNTTVTVSSTIHPLQTSSIVSSTSRITASQAFPSVPIVSFTSHNVTILSTISEGAPPTASNSHTIVPKVSTYLGTQLTITEILTTTSTAQSTVTEISPTASPSKRAISNLATYLGTESTFTEISPTSSAYELTVSGVLPTAIVTQPIVSENSPRVTQSTVTTTTSTASSKQLTITEVLPTASATQPTVTEISSTTPASQQTVPEITPTTSTTQPTVSDMSPKATTSSQTTVIESLQPTRDIQPTTSEISPRASHTQPSVSKVLQQPSSEISPTAPVTQASVPGILPTESDALPTVSEILPTEPDVQPTISEISPTEPDIQPPASETSRKTPKDPDTSQKPSILLPRTPDIEPTTLPSNVPPTLSHDREGKTEKNSSATLALIAGLPVLAIIIAAIIVCCVYRRRHSNKRLRSCSVTGSEMTMDTIVMSPQVDRAHQRKDERGYYTVDLKDPPSFEIPGYDVPYSVINSSFEEEDKARNLHCTIVQPQSGNNNKRIDNGLNEPVKKSEPITDQVLEDKEEGASDSSSNRDPMYYVLEGPYPESIKGPGQPDAKTLKDPEEPIYCSLDEVFPVSSKIPCPEPNSEDESLYNVLEIRKISLNDPIFNPSERPNSDTNNNNTIDSECDDEPLYDVLERRYFGGSKVPPHYVQMTPDGPIFKPISTFLEDRLLEGSDVPEHYVHISPSGLAFSTLDKLKRASLKESNNYPERGSEPVGEILEGFYLEGSEVPEKYVQISPNGPVFSILEKLYRQSVKGSRHVPNCPSEPVGKGSSHDPKCADKPEDVILEEHYLEGSEVPENYVRVSPNGPVFSILEKLYRQSIKGFTPRDPNGASEPKGKDSSPVPKCADEASVDKIVEERYLEGSEVPENYVPVAPNGPVFSILERLYRQSIKGSTRDPNGASEPASKGSSQDPKSEDEPAVENNLEECYFEGSEVSENYMQVAPNGPVFSILERLYRKSIKGYTPRDPNGASEPTGKGSSPDPKSADEASVDNIVEERYLEGSEVPENYERIAPNGPVFSILEKLYRQSIKGPTREPVDKGSSRDPKCSDEPEVDNTLEERYFEGSDVPENYERVAPNGPVFSILEKLYRQSIKGSNYKPKCADGPDDKTLERRYFEGSEVPTHYVQISPNGPDLSTLEKLSRNSVRRSTHWPKSDKEPIDKILEERYLEGSKVPEQYMWVSRKGSAFKTLDRLYRNSVRKSNYDPDCVNKQEENVLEGRYLKGSEVPEHYVRISRSGSVFSIVEKSDRNSVKGPSKSPEGADEPVDSLLEGRYFEVSEVPEQYMWVSRKGSTLKALDKSNRDSLKGSNHDPERQDEPVDNVLEGRYFEGSDVPRHYVRISRDGSVFSIIEKSNRNSVKESNHDPKS